MATLRFLTLSFIASCAVFAGVAAAAQVVGPPSYTSMNEYMVASVRVIRR